MWLRMIPTGLRIWSLTSPRVKRISGSENLRAPPQKDFCNNILLRSDITDPTGQVGFVPTGDIKTEGTGGAT